MRVELFLLGIAVFVSLAHESNASNKCYYAKTCIHDGKEKCGRNSEGKVRRFFDSCDMKEYNCLKAADYTKTTATKCQRLPPIDEEPSKNEKEGGNDDNEHDDNIKNEFEDENDAANEPSKVVETSDAESDAGKVDEADKTKKLIDVNENNEAHSPQSIDTQKIKEIKQLKGTYSTENDDVQNKKKLKRKILEESSTEIENDD